MQTLTTRSGGRRAAFGRVVSDPPMRRVLLAYLAFSAVVWALWVTVLVYARSEGSAATVGLVAGAQLVPAALLTPVLAKLVDRLPRSVAATVAYLGMAAVLGVAAWMMLASFPFPVVILMAVLAYSLQGMCRCAHHSLVPALADGPAELVAANVGGSASEGFGLFLGPALAGSIFAASSTGVALVACVGLLVVAGLLTAGLTGEVSLPDAPPAGEDTADPLEPGLRDRARTGVLLLVGAVEGVREGAVNVLIVLLALDVLGLGQSGAGYLNSISGLGAVVGGVVASTLVGRSRLAPSLLFSGSMTGLAMILVAFLPLAALLLGVIGLGYSLTRVATRTMLQRVSSLAEMGRLFGSLEGFNLAGVSVGAVTAPLLGELIGVERAFALLGVLVPIALALVWRWLRLADLSATVPTSVLETLRRIDVVSGLGPAPLEILARGARETRLGPGRAAVVEGEIGDEMFVIRSGSMEVSRGGDAMAELGPGDIFGEIALLGDEPRIATVRATEPTILVAVGRESFLAALSTDRSARHAIEQLAHSRRRDTMGG